MIHRGFKYRIYPSKSQEQQLAQFFGRARYVYNYGLERKKTLWDLEKRKFHYPVKKNLHSMKKLKKLFAISETSKTW